MLLRQLQTADPLEARIYGERYLNDSKGAFSEYSDIDPAYDPQSDTAFVEIPYAFLAAGQCTIFSSSPTDATMIWVVQGEQYRFCWHPDTPRNALEAEGVLRSQPTSSTRTLLTEGNNRVYIKTDLDKKHFRFIRRLKRDAVQHSILINSDLRTFCESGQCPPRFAFLAESLGVVIDQGPHKDSGVIYRDADPFPASAGRNVLLPYHSIYANDPFAPEDPPLGVQLVRLNGSKNPKEYFIESIVGPILEAWVSLVSLRGLLPELHGQNALLEIDQNLRPRRVVQRDFQGVYSDSGIRNELGIAPFTRHVVGEERGTSVESQYSHVYDGMIGRYLLARLTNTFCRYFPYSYQDVASGIREYHHGLSGWQMAKFPRTTFRFSHSSRSQIGNDVTLIDTGIEPEFR